MLLPNKKKEFTIEDIYALPEGVRAELIDGQIFYMTPPSTTHQRVLHHLDRIIGNYIQSKGGSCEIFPAPFAVFLNKNSKTYVEPDISIICDPGKLNNKGCIGAPDWIIEIVSPGSRRMDYNTKLFKYYAAGVREYWIADPDKNCITVYNLQTEDSEQYTFSDCIKTGIYDDLTIDFKQITM